MSSRTNRNASRRSNNPHIYTSSVPTERDEFDSTFLSPERATALDDPPGERHYEFGPGDDIERDGVGGLIQFDTDEEAFERYKVREDLTAPSPLSLEPSSSVPSYAEHSRDREGVGTDMDRGHTRAPVLARELTMLESFSRTVRNYVPSSIPVPSAAPSPPRVSRPVSFGSFMTASGALTATAPRRASTTATQKRGRSSGIQEESNPVMGGPSHGSPTYDPVVFDSGDEEQEAGRGLITYPGMSNEEDIVWAGWDVLQKGSASKAQRLLMLGYRSGLQVWNCTDISSVTEMLNLSGAHWGCVSFAGVLPAPSKSEDDIFLAERPLIGLVQVHDESDCVIYSLNSHRIVKRLSLPGSVCFSANANFIVVSTASPPTIHILSSSSFVTLFTIPSSSITPFAFTSSPSHTGMNTVLSPDLEINDAQFCKLISRPRPIFTLSHRLLAFASSPPPLEPAARSSSVQPRTRTPPPDRPGSRFGISQAELGNAAAKVGGSMLTGMKSLGGMAYSAARTRLSGVGAAVDEHASDASAPTMANFTNIFFSKSAPAASGSHERRFSQSSDASFRHERGHAHQSDVNNLSSAGTIFTALPALDSPSTKGSHVTILDMAPLMSFKAPDIVCQFLVSKDQPICGLKFSSDGVSLIVTPKDGQVVKVLSIRPIPKPLRVAFEVFERHETRPPQVYDNARLQGQDVPAGAPWHMYDLRRGRTSAIIESSQYARDGRWVAIGTRKRTVHVFSVNPYGGKPDVRSHMDGKIRNATELQPLSTDVTPIVRLRFKAARSKRSIPLAFTFIQSTESTLPASLLPLPASYPSSPKSLSAQSSPAGPAHPLSLNLQRPTNFQDLLVFDPEDGILSLRRFVVEENSSDQGFSVPTSVPVVGGTSVSLPGMTSMRHMSTSPSNRSRSPQSKPSGLTQMLEKTSELVGKEAIVATWSLRRGRDWRDIKYTIVSGANTVSPERLTKADWLAQAELTTGSRSRRILPRTIYLSHQFSFYAFGEDYHALVRRYQLDIPATKIEVRKEVEASAYSTGMGESFVQGMSIGSDVRRASSSFDEPLASAISADLNYTNPSPPVIPMLPNGTPGSRPFGNAIPIRSMASGLSDGMNESLVRIRREIGKVRSPKMSARPDHHGLSASVALEFDEEDEDFALPDDNREGEDDAVSRSTSGGGSVSTPSTHAQALGEEEGEEEAWEGDGWSPEDKEAVDDAERFDDLVVGFMDEEQVRVVEAVKKSRRRNRRGGV